MKFLRKFRKLIAACSGLIILFTSMTVHAENVNVTVGEALSYPQGFSYMTHYFYMDGQLAYCLEPRLGPMPDGNYETEIISDEGENGLPLLVRILACGYGGPNDLTQIYFPGASERDRYIYTHIAAGYAYQTNENRGIYDITGLTDEQFEACGLGDFVRAAWNSGYKGTIKMVRVNGYQNIGYLASYYLDTPTPPADYKLYITKKDMTDRALAGAVFDVYSDSGCTNLIGRVDSTDASGQASFTVPGQYGEIYVKEYSAPYGYVKDKNIYRFEGGNDAYLDVKNEKTTGKIVITKKDSETPNVPQGDANFENAEYTIYADETVKDVFDSSVIYEKDSIVATLITDSSGVASKDNLPLGKYRIKETKAPKGYLVNQTETKFEIKYDNGENKVVETKLTLTDDVIKGFFEINKSKLGFDEIKVQNAGFCAYLKSQIPKDSNGDYDFKKASPIKINEDGGTVLYTDENGFAKSCPIPYGTYIVREEIVPKNYKKCEDFEMTVEVNERGKPTKTVDLPDDYFKIKFRLNKVDKESKEIIKPSENDEVLFNIFDVTRNEYGEKNLKLDQNGYVKTERLYEAGTYRIEEIDAPNGYLINENALTFEVDDESNITVDDEGEEVFDAYIENEMYVGEIQIVKTGEKLINVQKGDEEQKKDAVFTYKEMPLEGVVFGLYASEDIFYPDQRKDADGNRQILYAKDELLGKEVSNEDGIVSFTKDKYLLVYGDYYIREEETIKGYIRLDEKIDVSFKENPNNESIVLKEEKISNKRQKLSVRVRKLDEADLTTLNGGEFALYADSDILGQNGEMLIKKGEYLGSTTTLNDGAGKFNLDLTNGKYLVKESKAPDGYFINGEEKSIELIIDDSGFNKTESVIFYDEKMPVLNKANGSIVKGATKLKVTKNNYKTEDNGTMGYSILLQKEEKNDKTFFLFGSIIAALGLSILISVWIKAVRGNRNG